IATRRSPTCWGSSRARRNRSCITRAWRCASISSAEGPGGTMKDQWTDRLSEYLDGELGAAERAALEGHLATCGECGATLAELRRVVARAGDRRDVSRQALRRAGRGSRARARARPRAARHHDRAGDREEPADHQPGDPRGAKRAGG